MAPWVLLVPHPETSGVAVRTIAVRAQRSAQGELALTFRLDGDLTQIRVPAPRPPRLATRLWEHTCFEVFIAVDGTVAYHEINLAPSGEWTVYAFFRYREGGRLDDSALAPQIGVRSIAGRLDLDATVRLDRLSPAYARAALRLGLAAVIEDTDGRLSYWALRHPTGRPDFHHPEAFEAQLEPARLARPKRANGERIRR